MKRIEISVFGDEGRVGYAQAQLGDEALREIAEVVNKHLRIDALNVESPQADARQTVQAVNAPLGGEQSPHRGRQPKPVTAPQS